MPLPDHISVLDEYHLREMTITLRLIDFLQAHPIVLEFTSGGVEGFEQFKKRISGILQEISEADRNRLLDNYHRQPDSPMVEEWRRLLYADPNEDPDALAE